MKVTCSVFTVTSVFPLQQVQVFFFQFVNDIRGSWCFIFILAAHAGQNPGFLLKGCSLNVVKIFLKGKQYIKVNSDSTFHLHPFSLYEMLHILKYESMSSCLTLLVFFL